jgi:hypothetical protein
MTLHLYGIGYDSIEPRGDKRHDDFVADFLQRSRQVTIIPQPANISSSVISHDTVVMLADVMRKEGIDAEAGRPRQARAGELNGGR